MNTLHDTPLGHTTIYPQHVDAARLCPIPRALSRSEIKVDANALPFTGLDFWNAYELSWLDAHGQPRVAIVELRVPADTPSLIESKSLKLYLNGYAQTRCVNTDAVRTRIAADLSAAAGAPIDVALTEPRAFAAQRIAPLDGDDLDALELAFDDGAYAPVQPAHLRAGAMRGEIEETLTTRAFRSNCPVTGQPDWADVQVRYRGAPIDREGLLRYLVSYRNHAGFHEACVERIFVEVMRRCAPRALAVYARFTRRGGLDINPFRSTPGFAALPANLRTARQ